MNRFLLLFLAIALAACNTGEIDYQATGQLGVYIADPINPSDNPTNINQLKPGQTLWISHNEIAFYDWSAHMMYLKKDKPREAYSGRFFVVKEGSQPLFIGHFFPVYSSHFPLMPSVIAADNFFYPLNMVPMGGFSSYHPAGSAISESFKRSLSNSGLIRNGIKVELKEVNKTGAGKVNYTFKVTNMDNEVLYIPDPDKMGPDRYHYYTNGVWFFDNLTSYFAQNKTVTPSPHFNDSWYYPLGPGEAISRSVSLDGFGPLPTGQFTAYLSFRGVLPENNSWKRTVGRIWAGEINVSETLSF